ncbi:hypothetical protein I4U23_011336 [Adineta vaga]|nr:hypothetical protein I4U23_011336 [Adineta vaga]
MSIDESYRNPGKIDLFYIYISSFYQFTELRYLTLPNVPSAKLLTKIIKTLPYSLNIAHLTINCHMIQKLFVNYQLFIDII